MIKFFVLILSFVCSVSQAQQENTPQVFATVGPEFRSERNAEQNVAPKQMTSLSLGVGYSHWIYFLETGSFEETSGNSSLLVKRKFENYLGGVIFESETIFLKSKPFLAGLFGFSRELIDTTVTGQTTNDVSRPYWVGGAGTGLRLANINPIWVSIEVRLVFSEHQDPSPSVGGLLRLGLLL
ncbi:MAG: hypothetical protein BroJett040_14260 [Oligoflexia bacterium]|nr:MAG: hypothetical protein BroJett040_14260 [Oligoflexia bacterium]